MGQYYRIVNVDKREVMVSFDFGNGQKLMEWSYVDNYMTNALLNLLADEWKGDRVYVIGDYADTDDMTECWAEAYAETEKEYPGGIYRATDEWLHRVPAEHNICEYRDGFENTKDVEYERNGYRYIYNHADKIYIDLEHCPLEWVWFGNNGEVDVASVFPLSLLLAMGNGRGGGDYRGADKCLCGDWCDTVRYLEITKEKLDNDYSEEIYPFTENNVIVPYTDREQFIETERKGREARK